MLADIPSTIRVKATTGVVNVPSHGLVSSEPVLVLLENFRGPRRKLVWGFIQRALAIGALVEAKVGDTAAPDTAPAVDPQPDQPRFVDEPKDVHTPAGGASPAPVAAPAAVAPTATATGLPTANLF
jgi:hypothetical protein